MTCTSAILVYTDHILRLFFGFGDAVLFQKLLNGAPYQTQIPGENLSTAGKEFKLRKEGFSKAGWFDVALLRADFV